MKYEDTKVGQKVVDRWFPDWGVGEVKKKLKTTIHIYFSGLNKIIKFDKQHLQFLDKEK